MNVFVSYRRENIQIVSAIVDYLKAQGHDVWAYYQNVPDDIQRERDQRQTLKLEGLDRADVLVVLVSAEFEQSHGMAREIIYAQSHNKLMLPVIIDSAELPYSLLGTNPLDISQDVTAGLPLLQERLQQLAQTRPAATPHYNAAARKQLAAGLEQETPIERVFIAYSHRQRPLAEQLYELLVRNGKAVFYDQKLKAGATWRQTIQKALDDATHVVVIWTPDAAQSDEVEREVSYALAERKVIVPILSNEVSRLPYHLHGLQHIVLENDLGAIEGSLVKAIGQSAADEDIWQ